MTKLYTAKRARHGLIHTAYFRAVSQVSTILGYIVLVRGLSEHDFGVFNLFYAVIPLMSAAISLGLEHVLRRYEPEYLSLQQHAKAAWLVRFVGRTRLGVNLIVLALIFSGWYLITPIFQLDPYRMEFLIFSVLILVYFQQRVLDIALTSHMLHQYAVGGLAALAVTKLLGYSIFTWLGDLSLRNALMIDTFGHGLVYAGIYIAHRRLCALPAGTMPEKPDKTETRRLLRYGLFYNFNDAGTLTLNPRIDNFFLAGFMDPIAAGTYSFYTRLAKMVDRILPMHLFDNVVRPLFFATSTNQADVRVPQYFTLLTNTGLLLALPVTAFAAVYHHDIVELVFGGRFQADSILLPIVLLFMAGKVISTPVILAAQYAEKAAIILLSKIFGIVNLGLLLLLIPAFGVYGAAIATGASAIVKDAFIWWFVRDRAVWLNWKAVVIWSVACWGGFYLGASAFRETVELPLIVHLLAGTLMCGLVALLFLRTPVLAETDRVIIASVFKGREQRLLRQAGLIR